MLPRLSSVLFMALFLVSIGAGAIGTAVIQDTIKATQKEAEPVKAAPVKKTKRLMYRGLG